MWVLTKFQGQWGANGHLVVPLATVALLEQLLEVLEGAGLVLEAVLVTEVTWRLSTKPSNGPIPPSSTS